MDLTSLSLKKLSCFIILLISYSPIKAQIIDITSTDFVDVPDICSTNPTDADCILTLPTYEFGKPYSFTIPIESGLERVHTNFWKGNENFQCTSAEEKSSLIVSPTGVISLEMGALCSYPLYSPLEITFTVSVEYPSMVPESYSIRIPVKRQALKIALVVDISENMNETYADGITTKFDKSKYAINKILSELLKIEPENDSISLSYFNSSIIQPDEGVFPTDFIKFTENVISDINSDIASQIPSGSSKMGEGLLDAKNKLLSHHNSNEKKLVFLFSDGQQENGSTICFDGNTFINSGDSLNNFHSDPKDSINYFTISTAESSDIPVIMSSIAHYNKGLSFKVDETNNSAFDFIWISYNFNTIMAGETPNPIELRIIDLYPHNDSSDVALDQNLNLHFNSNVNIESGNIYIVKHDDDTNYEEISVGSDQVTGDGTSKITIQPVNNFESNTRYYILADENSFSTDAGSGFAGITSKKYWSFTSKDVESPDVFLESNENNPTNAEAFKLIIRFSEKVTGFTMDDLVASNASLDNLEMIEADSVWSSDVFPVTDGRVTINMASDMVTDAAGNGNNSAAEFNIYYDATRPSVSISSSNDTIVEAQFNVSIDFSERVLGFQSPAIHIENGEINSFSTNDSISFLAIARAETPGNIMIHIAENQTVDSAGNPNTSSNELKTTYIISTSVDIMKKQGVSMYSNEGFLIIHFLNDKLTNFNSAFIEIYNLNGSLVKKEKIINNARYKTFLGSKKTVYIVKLTLGNQVYYAKIYF